MKNKDKINKESIILILCYAASIMFFVAAIVGFTRGSEIAPAWLCFGSMMLCFGSAYASKANKKRNEGNQDEKEQK